MRIFTFLSNKKSPAPLVYITLQISLLSSFVILCPTIINIQVNPFLILFWLASLFSLVFYFNSHLRDPGYIQHDAIFLAENGTTFSHTVETRRRTNSLIKLKSRKTRSTTETDINVLTTIPENKDRISEINQNYFKKLQEGDGTSVISTNFGIMTNMATEILSPLEKKKENENEMKYEIQNQDIAVEFESTPSFQDIAENVVACEPSMDQEESFQNYNILNFGTKDGDDIEDVIKNKNPISKLEENKTNKKNNNPDEKKKSSKIKKQRKDINKWKKKKKDKGIENNHENLGNSCQFEANPDIELVKFEYMSFQQEPCLAFKDKDFIVPSNIHSCQNMVSPHKGRTLLIPEINDEPMKSSERSFLAINQIQEDSNQITLHTQQSSITKDQSKNVILIKPKFNENPQNDDIEQQATEKENEILYVERRYCTICGFEQPLRAKHCKECERCVAQYDHHCPWLGTCIGEKNHFSFYLFLFFQLIQLSWAEYQVFYEMITREYKYWASENTGRIVLVCLFTFFVIMVFSLFSYHTYLALVNLTTWESLSWYKISYLKEWHEDWGSPFSQGVIKNLKFFCCHDNKYLYHWKMPEFKRPLDEQDVSP